MIRASLRLAAPLLAALSLALLGCSGDEGAVDEAGSDGSTGPTTGSTSTGSTSTGSTSTGTSTGTHGAGGAGSGTTTTGSGAGGAVSGGGSEASAYPNPDWTTGDPASVGLDATKLAEAIDVASQDGSYCLLVLRHGVLVSETYFNGTDATTRNSSWSLAKSYTSSIVGVAIDRGDIHSIDDPVANYVPEWQGTDNAVITVRDLLQMTSGLTWSAFQDYVTMATFTSDQTGFALDLDLDNTPGSTWIYHNGGVQVLERLMRNATGMPMEEYAQAHLWSQIGMGAEWAHDDAGDDTAYANVLATCRDHARFGTLYLHGGQWANGAEVLSPGWVAAATSPSQDLNRAYGYYFWLNGQTPAMDAMMQPFDGELAPYAPADMFMARGFGNQFIDVIPSLDMVVVRFGQDPETSFDLGALFTDSRFTKHDDIMRPILEAVQP